MNLEHEVCIRSIQQQL